MKDQAMIAIAVLAIPKIVVAAIVSNRASRNTNMGTMGSAKALMRFGTAVVAVALKFVPHCSVTVVSSRVQ